MASLHQLFLQNAPKAPQWMRSVTDVLHKGLDMTQRDSLKEDEEEEEGAVWIESNGWMAVDRDLMVQYPGDVEKWRQFMKFRRKR